jgi:hypothetical protein
MKIKPIIFFAIPFLILGCGNQKETVDSDKVNNSNTEIVEEIVTEKSENYRVIGIVVLNEGNCPIYIKAKDGDREIRMYPMNLEAKYKVDGMKLKFAYERSRGAQPEECDIDMVVSMSDVTLMR